MKSNCCNEPTTITTTCGDITKHFFCTKCYKLCGQLGWVGTSIDSQDHWEYQGSKDTYNSFWKTVITSPQWQEWSKKQREECRWDTTEAEECGWLSEEHFQDFLNFTYVRTRRFD